MIHSFLIAGLVMLPVMLIIMVVHLRGIQRRERAIKNPKCKATTKAMIADAKLTILILLSLWLIYFATYLVAFTDLLEVWYRWSDDVKTIAIIGLIAISILLFIIATMLLSVNIFQYSKDFFIFLKNKLLKIRENYRSKRRYNRIMKKISKTPANYQKK